MESDTADDGMLVARIGKGDERALEQFYERHHASLAAYLSLFTSDRGTVDEAIQDAMLGVWKGAPGFRSRSSVRSWLFGISRRRLMDILRRKRVPVTGEEALVRYPDPSPSPENAVIFAAAEREVVGAIQRLSRIHQEVLVLTFAHELSYEELSNVLDVPLGTIRSRLSNARKALREQLGTQTP